MSNAIISFPGLGIEGLNPSRYFTIFGRNIYWYGVIIALGFLLAVLYCGKRARQFGLKADSIADMLLCAVPAAVVCARLYYCLTYHDANGVNPYLQDPVSILYIWEGGLAIYGGVIGAVIAVAIYCKVKKIPTGAMLDLGALGLLIGQSIGRWGNFINREAYGVNPDGSAVEIFCRMGLTVDGTTTYVHPTFLYESRWNALGFVLIHVLTKKNKRRYDGQVFLWYLAWYGFGRMLIEGLREDYLPLGASGLRISQLLSIILLVLSLFLLFYNRVLKYRDPKDMLVNCIAAAQAGTEEVTAEEEKSQQPAEAALEEEKTAQTDAAEDLEEGEDQENDKL